MEPMVRPATPADAVASPRDLVLVAEVAGEARAGAHAFYERLGFTATKKQLNDRKPL